MSPLVIIDDKHVPLYRVVWVSATPHFCGEEDCVREGEYEVRIEGDDSLWVGAGQRDQIVAKLEEWCGDPPEPDDEEPEAW